MQPTSMHSALMYVTFMLVISHIFFVVKVLKRIYTFIRMFGSFPYFHRYFVYLSRDKSNFQKLLDTFLSYFIMYYLCFSCLNLSVRFVSKYLRNLEIFLWFKSHKKCYHFFNLNLALMAFHSQTWTRRSRELP